MARSLLRSNSTSRDTQQSLHIPDAYLNLVTRNVVHVTLILLLQIIDTCNMNGYYALEMTVS